MKLSIEQANKLLSELPGGVVVVADDGQADATADIDTIAISINEQLAGSLKPSLEEQLKPTLEAAFTGRHLGALRSAAQRVFNVPRRELENMSIEQLLAKCKGALEVQYTQTGDQKQTQLEMTVQEYEAQIEQLRAEYESRLGDERAKFVGRDIAARCAALVAQLPRKGGDIQEQAEMLQYKMQAGYELRYNESTKQIEFYKDGAPALDENNNPLKDEAIARSWAEKTGILVNDTRHVKPSDVMAGQQGAYATGILTIADEDSTPMDAIAAWAGE